MMYQAAIKMSCPRATLARFLPRLLASRRYRADKYVCLVLAAAAAASPRAPRSHRSPLRVRPEKCLPADSLLPGHMPAHDASCCGVGNRLMSAPVSAMRISASRSLTPGIVHSRLRMKRRDLGLDLAGELLDRGG